MKNNKHLPTCDTCFRMITVTADVDTTEGQNELARDCETSYVWVKLPAHCSCDNQ